MNNIAAMADAADMIVNGYAFTAWNGGYRVLNLNRLDRAAVLSKDGEVLETSIVGATLAVARVQAQANAR